jgi:hypothetical protein
VAARFEINAPGITGGEAGLDVKGDGSLVPYAGTIFKRELRPRAGESPFDLIRKALG